MKPTLPPLLVSSLSALVMGLASAVALSLSAQPAAAQIYAVELNDQKAIKKNKKHLVTVNGKQVLVGEPRAGITYDKEKNTITFNRNGRVELYVANPADPTKVPYKIKDGTMVPTKKGVVGVPGGQVARISLHLRDQSLYGLSKEYEFRREQIDELERELEGLGTGDAGWFLTHRRLISSLERMQTWLSSTAFPKAAEKVSEEIGRQLKVVAKQALDARAERAGDSIRRVDTPEKLTQASKEISDGSIEFHVQESQHVRMTYATKVLSDSRAKELLQLAERLIDGFRVEFVDPYVGDDYPDQIPDGMFHEFWFCVDNVKYHERFYEEYYGQNWGKHRAERLESRGARGNLNTPRRSLDFWREDENMDFDGIVAHNMGHVLSELHYNGSLSGMSQDWLSEGVGYYLSLEYLGRNNVTCGGFYEPKKGGYVTPAGEDKKRGEKPLRLGLREFYHKVALELGRKIDVMAMRLTFEMDEADLSKAWSLYDYIAHKEGMKGQLWLRSACKRARDKASFIREWRKDSNEIFGIEGQDVFKLMDQRWREYAQRGQETGDKTRKR